MASDDKAGHAGAFKNNRVRIHSSNARSFYVHTVSWNS
jgi:hypothetical protein